MRSRRRPWVAPRNGGYSAVGGTGDKPPPPPPRRRVGPPQATIEVYGNDMGAMLRAATAEAAYLIGEEYYYRTTEPFEVTPDSYLEQRDHQRGSVLTYRGTLRIESCMHDVPGATPGRRRPRP